MIVGGEAVIYYGYARVTGDIDIFYDGSQTNAEHLFAALEEFWQGKVPGVRGPAELMPSGTIVQFGVPPNRIDLINRIAGVSFAKAWPRRLRACVRVAGQKVPLWYLGLGDLLRNKRAAGRPKDLADLAFLQRRNR